MRLTVSFCVLASLALAGCGSSYTLRKGDNIDVGCLLKTFFEDKDNDGWGFAGGETAELCEASTEQNLTASNGKDCDDSDPDVTGIVGSVCPANIIANDADLTFDGIVTPETPASEMVIVHSDSRVLRYTEAQFACADWAGTAVTNLDENGELPEGTDPEYRELGHLATFGDNATKNEVEGLIADAVAFGDGGFAGFLGIEWEGDLEDGAWVWVDDSDLDINALGPFCDGSKKGPTPGDFFPNLNPADPEHADALNDELPNLRLAWVLDEDEEWCLGTPWDAVPVALRDDVPEDPEGLQRYTLRFGHFICEREQPDPETATEFVQDG